MHGNEEKSRFKAVVINPYLWLTILSITIVIAGYYYVEEFFYKKLLVEQLKEKYFVDDLYDIDLIDKENLWAVGYWGTILHSNDGGDTWNYQRSGVESILTAVDFIDINRGWVVGRFGKILHTTDGGRNWYQQDSQTNRYLTDICVINERNIWVVGEFGTILHTEDGGKNWQLIKIPLDIMEKDIDEEIQLDPYDVLFNRICFIDSQTGWIVGEFGTILHTRDGGKNWVRQNANTKKTLYSVDFCTYKFGMIVGSDAIALNTIDGGKTWKKWNLYTTKPLFDVVFPMKGHKPIIYICGKGTMIMTYAATGAWKMREEEELSEIREPEEWFKLDIRNFDSEYSYVYKYRFFDLDFGLAVGKDGVILRCEADKNWEKIDYKIEKINLHKNSGGDKKNG